MQKREQRNRLVMALLLRSGEVAILCRGVWLPDVVQWAWCWIQSPSQQTVKSCVRRGVRAIGSRSVATLLLRSDPIVPCE